MIDKDGSYDELAPVPFKSAGYSLFQVESLKKEVFVRFLSDAFNLDRVERNKRKKFGDAA